MFAGESIAKVGIVRFSLGRLARVIAGKGFGLFPTASDFAD